MGAKLGGGASFGGSPIPTIAGMEGSDVTADINVTPMIDVMLVLLIIFMVVTPAMAGYQAQLPKARMAAPEKDDRLTLRIDNTGKYFIEGATLIGPIPIEQLKTKLTEAYASRPDDHTLYLKADNAVGYDKVLSAIDAARAAGVRRVGAITELPKGVKAQPAK